MPKFKYNLLPSSTSCNRYAWIELLQLNSYCVKIPSQHFGDHELTPAWLRKMFRIKMT